MRGFDFQCHLFCRYIDSLRGKIPVLQALSLEGQRQFQLGGRKILKKHGEVVAREGVVSPTASDQSSSEAGAVGFHGFGQKVFYYVAGAAGSGGIVERADVQPKLARNHRECWFFNQYYAQTICQFYGVDSLWRGLTDRGGTQKPK
jgi:hypothetical protein